MQERARLRDIHAAVEAAKKQAEEAAVANADADRLAALHQAAETLEKEEKDEQAAVDASHVSVEALEKMEEDEKHILAAAKAAEKADVGKLKHAKEVESMKLASEAAITEDLKKQEQEVT
jgi:hypothetical protein